MLLDECVPRRLGSYLEQHDVRTAPQMGWAAKKNGDLLRVAQDDFDVLVTTDQRLSYQQNVGRFEIAIVVLVAHRNKLEFLLPLLEELRVSLDEVGPGEVRRVGG